MPEVIFGLSRTASKNREVVDAARKCLCRSEHFWKTPLCSPFTAYVFSGNEAMIAMDREATDDACTDCDVPPGSPPWLTEELLCQTIQVWQPYYSETLSDEDAVAILTTFGRLLDYIAT